MTQFRFRLATLRKLREGVRDQRQAQLGEALEADRILSGQMAELEAEIGTLGAQYRKLSGTGTIDVDRLLDAQRYELILRAKHMGLEQQRKELNVEIERRRQALVEASREVRILDKLEEKQLKQFKAVEAARELKMLDEVAARGYRLTEEVS